MRSDKSFRNAGHPRWTKRRDSPKNTAQFRQEVANATQISAFHTLFPARTIFRHFTLFLGPTNSGKTYQALKILAAAQSGTYLAPLRLLALEVSETLNSWGVSCSMITGEERIEVEGAKHSARTIEMLSVSQPQEVCVIDEAQMLGDSDRGWAWTQAILGAQADHVCVIGAPESLPAIEKLLELTQEPFQVVNLERLSPLKQLEAPIYDFSHLRPGTAIITFSRSAVLGLKAKVERQTGQQVAVLYGALPPEVRRQQAHFFASGQAPFLVATDAIGMGLNLPIQTLLFAQDTKYINRRPWPLTPMEVRQIAGRAGRYGKNEVGFVGTFRIPIENIAIALQTEPRSIRRATLAPNLDHLLALARFNTSDDDSLARLFILFARSVKPDPKVYKVVGLENLIFLAQIADHYMELDLATRFAFATAPVPVRSILAVEAFEQMVQAVALNEQLLLYTIFPDIPDDPFQRLNLLETAMRVTDLYCWLHFRFPDHFPELDLAKTKRREINKDISKMLAQKSAPKIPQPPPKKKRIPRR